MTKSINSSSKECCMCGDSGISDQLYNCNLCNFRSQHRYCSNLYPKAEEYRVCNWCLKDEIKDNNSSNSSSDNSKEDVETDKMKNRGFNLKGRSGNSLSKPDSHTHIKKKKQRLMVEDVVVKSSDGIRKQVLRYKVRRRYKLLEEVSS